MQRALGFPMLCLLLNLHAAGCFSGNNDHFLALHQKRSGKPVFIYHHLQGIEKSLDIAPQKIYKHSYHSSSQVQIGKQHQIVNSAFPRPAYDPSLNLLAMSGQDLEVENLPIPAANVIVVVSIVLICFPLGLMLKKTMVTGCLWISMITFHNISHSLILFLLFYWIIIYFLLNLKFMKPEALPFA